MKGILKLAVYGIAAIAALSSCSKNEDVPSQKDIETKIIGKWKQAVQDGKDILTNDRVIKTFFTNQEGIHSISHYFEGEYLWLNKIPFHYEIKGNDLCETVNGSAKVFTKVLSIDETQLYENDYKIITPEGKELSVNTNLTYQKVTADYSKAIIGLWEGVEMTGDGTYGDANHRIKYKADGTYTYYDKVGASWTPRVDALSEYNVDGDWLAFRWQHKTDSVINYEWWDIDEITDTTMKWSALREKEDGSRYSTTFTWKRTFEILPMDNGGGDLPTPPILRRVLKVSATCNAGDVWNIDETVIGFFTENGTDKTVSYHVSDVNDGVASLSKDSGDEPLDGTTVYMVYAPGKTVADIKGTGDNRTLKYCDKLCTQTGTLAGLKDCIPMYATGTVELGTLSLNFNSAVAVFALSKITGLEANQEYSSIQICGEGLTNKGTFKIENNAFRFVNGADGTITVRRPEPYKSDASGNILDTVYFVVPAAALGNTTLTLNNGNSSKSTVKGTMEGMTMEAAEFYCRNEAAATIKIPYCFEDLGVTNSAGKFLYWAKSNIGASYTMPQNYGDYYAWGANRKAYTEIKRTYDSYSHKDKFEFKFITNNTTDNYRHYQWNPNMGFNLCNAPYFRITTYENRIVSQQYTKYTDRDKKTTLERGDDIAISYYNGSCMPTKDDFVSLVANCVWIWTDNYASNKSGYIIYKAKNDDDRGKACFNGKWMKWNISFRDSEAPESDGYTLDDVHIFLPAAGEGRGVYFYDNGRGNYWSSSFYSNGSGETSTRTPNGLSYCFSFYSGYIYPTSNNDRCLGMTIRPVLYGD